MKHTYTNIRNVVVAGMGGSAIGGDVVSVFSSFTSSQPQTFINQEVSPRTRFGATRTLNE